VIRAIVGGAAAAVLLSGPAQAAARNSSPALAWVVSPTDAGCRVELELVGRSGSITPISLISDGQLISLRFFKDDLPTRAFLPIRIDKARFSNLMLRGDGAAGELVLSEETLAAMRKGGTLGVAWLSEEPLTTSLAGSEQGLSDLRVCGAQTTARQRERAAAERAAKDRADAEARAKALNDAQLAAVQAQTAAAEAQRRQVEEAAARQRRAEAAQTERAYAEARQRAYEEERRRGYPSQYDEDDEDDRWALPQRPVWPPPRYYNPYR